MSDRPLIWELIGELEREANNPSFYGYGAEPTSSNLVGYTAQPLCLMNRRASEQNEGRKYSIVEKDGFQVTVDVAIFQPHDLSVKVVDNLVIIEGKHEEREDVFGLIKRRFVRRHKLPNGYDANRVISTLSSDGVLMVSVPKPQFERKPYERFIHIQKTGPAHIIVKKNPGDKKYGEKANGGHGEAGDKKYGEKVNGGHGEAGNKKYGEKANGGHGEAGDKKYGEKANGGHGEAGGKKYGEKANGGHGDAADNK